MIALMNEQQMLAAAAEEVREAIRCAGVAQIEWAARAVKARAQLIGSLRPLLADEATAIAQTTAAVGNRPVAEKLVSEVLPLLDACRFLEKNAARILRPKRFGARGRPIWLHGSSFEVRRKAFGVMLIVGPANYPLFIPAVQMLHALAAGNAVLIKPAEGATAPIAQFVDLIAARSGIPADLIQILPESPEAARLAVRIGIDKAIFTGSSENGRSFLADLAKQNTPSVMELSGADSVFVRADADVELAAKAIEFGLSLNDGETCMAPHTIVAHRAVAERLTERLGRIGIPAETLVRVQDDEQAIEFAAMDEHGLGAAVFSRDADSARAFAERLPTGFATINDIIVPTADPRFPFGGVRGSGFGVTRGAEGLLEMTYPQAIAIRRARFLPHLEKPAAGDAEMFAAFCSMLHGRGLRPRLAALRKVIVSARTRLKSKGGTR